MGVGSGHTAGRAEGDQEASFMSCGLSRVVTDVGGVLPSTFR